MNVTTVGRKINLRGNFIEHVEKRLSKFDKYFDDENATATVTCRVEKERHTVEILMKSRGLLYRAERTAPSLQVAFDTAADQLVKQIVKHKDTLGARIKKGVPELDIAVEEEIAVSTLVREKRFPVSAMTVDEAVLQMDMLSHNFYMFKNESTGIINVVYRRNDGNYGLLVPLD